MHVLVVDDVDDVREMLRLTLEHLGCRVTEASDGEEALKMQAESPADVVLTDIVMPGKEGVETIEALRRDYPNLKIVAMSGHDLASTWLRLAERMGVSSVLIKPFDTDSLAKAVGVSRTPAR